MSNFGCDVALAAGSDCAHVNRAVMINVKRIVKRVMKERDSGNKETGSTSGLVVAWWCSSPGELDGDGSVQIAIDTMFTPIERTTRRCGGITSKSKTRHGERDGDEGRDRVSRGHWACRTNSPYWTSCCICEVVAQSCISGFRRS